MPTQEKPIIIKGAMIRANLAGTKHQTRRVIKPQLPFDYLCHYRAGKRAYGCISGTGESTGWVWNPAECILYNQKKPSSKVVRCPYGKPGDRLWARETHYRWTGCGDAPSYWVRSLDGERYQSRGYIGDRDNDALHEGAAACIKVPSIFMPRFASRILLEVTDVRVERVQEITEADAENEGVEWMPDTSFDSTNYVRGFAELWDSINAKPKPAKRNPYTNVPEKCYVSYPWEDIRETRHKGGVNWYVIGNPFVWVVTFKRIERQES